MALCEAKVTLKGQTPLLMNAFPMVAVEAIEKKSREEQAERATYRDPETKGLYVPGVNVQRALVSAASYSKGKGRGSLQRAAAACLLVTPERIPLGVDTYAIDTRPIVVPTTRGRVLRHRPRFDQWQIAFTLEWDDTLITEAQARRIVDDMGTRVGLLDFRPETKGPFGRCVVIEWRA